MADATKVLRNLQPLTWRGLECLAESHPYDFAHTQAERKWPYIDGAGHDWTGMEPLVFSAKLFFLNTLSGGKVWYPGPWEQWRVALFDGTAGPLVHPDLGEVNARVLRGRVEMQAQTEAGIIVDVSWTSSLDDPESVVTFTSPAADVAAAAKAADVTYTGLGFEYPDGVGDGAGFFEAWNQLKGAVISAQLSFEGAINKFLLQVSGVIDDLASLDSEGVGHKPALDALRTLWNSVKTAGEAAGFDARPIGARVLSAPTTLTAFAKETGNTLNEIMGLNLSALSKPMVPAGATLKYYT